MIFCPECANLLVPEIANDKNRFICQSCPYICPIDGQVRITHKFEPKKVDDIIGGDSAWENVDSTEGKDYFLFSHSICLSLTPDSPLREMYE